MFGKIIKDVEYMSAPDRDIALWGNRPIIIKFDDESILIPMSDDEGNDGGSLHLHNEKTGKTNTIGVI